MIVCLRLHLYSGPPLSDSGSDQDFIQEDNLGTPGDYDSRGCPLVPVAFSGMTGRLGNIISTYANFIALEYRIGHKYHLPLYMNFDPVNLTKPWLGTIFKNVSFPTAHWSNFSQVEISNYRDAGPSDVMLFNNSKTGGEFRDCDLNYSKVENVMPKFDELEQCFRDRSVADGTLVTIMTWGMIKSSMYVFIFKDFHIGF